MASRTAALLRDRSAHVRESAVRIAGYFGFRECADDLLASCGDADPAVRRAAIEHLAFLDDDRVFDTLAPALSDSDPRVRASAVHAIVRVDNPAVTASLAAALLDGDAWVRYFAARGLGEHRHAPALDELTHLALDDGAGHVRLAAIDALGRIGSPSAVPALAALSASDDAERAIAAVAALGNIPHADAWPPLEAALRGAGEERRAAAAASISRLAGKKAIELLQWTAAADESANVAAAAVHGLARIATTEDGSTAVKALIDLTAEAPRRHLVVPALAALPSDAIASVAEGLRDPRPQVRVAVVQSLGGMRRGDASRWLESALGDGAADVRAAALTELRHLGTRGGERRIVTLARTDPNPTVRRAALAVLEAASGGRGDSPRSAPNTGSAE
jgi:HEAT repeat protein